MDKIKEHLLYLWELFLDRTNLKEQPHLKNGFRDEEPKPEDYEHTELGARVKKKVLVPDGQWDKYRSDSEQQRRQGSETMACVTFSAMNALEEIINFYITSDDKEHQQIVAIFEDFELIQDGKAEFSDRFIAKVSGTSRRGNSFSRVANAIRHFGLLAEKEYPYVVGWNKYYSKVPEDLIAKGKRLVDLIEINYERVILSEFNGSKVYAPTQTSIASRSPRNKDGVYQASNLPKDHAVLNDSYVSPQYDRVFDTYKPFEKKFSWTFNFGTGILFSIHLKKNFNLTLLRELKADGKKIVVRPDAQGQAYVIEDYGLAYKDSTKDPVYRNIPLVDYMLRAWTAEGKIHWISEDNYKKLLNE